MSAIDKGPCNSRKETGFAVKSIIKSRTSDDRLKINLGFQIAPPDTTKVREKSNIPSIFRIKGKGYLARISEIQKQEDRA